MSDDMAIRPGVQLGYSKFKDKTTDPEAETSMMNVGANITLEKHFGGREFDFALRRRSGWRF